MLVDGHLSFAKQEYLSKPLKTLFLSLEAGGRPAGGRPAGGRPAGGRPAGSRPVEAR